MGGILLPQEAAPTWPQSWSLRTSHWETVPARPLPPGVLTAPLPLSSQFYISSPVQSSAWISNTHSGQSISNPGHTPLSPQTHLPYLPSGIVVVTGTTTFIAAQVKTFTETLGDALSRRNATRGVQHQVGAITTRKPRGMALASFASSKPGSRPYPTDLPATSSPLAPSAPTAPFRSNHTHGLPFPSPWQCSHLAAVTPVTQLRPSGCVTTCFYSKGQLSPLPRPCPDLPTPCQAYFSLGPLWPLSTQGRTLPPA